jgi:hypothetical protein
MRFLKLAFMLMMLILSMPLLKANAQESLEINYPKQDLKQDPNKIYIHELIELILAHTPKPYKLRILPFTMPQSRSIYEMTKANGQVDLLWSMTTDEREKKLIPIRIPIDKGLFGWRIPIIQNKHRSRFANIEKIEDLYPYTAGQVHDWPDVDILKSNQLKVVVSTEYSPLFHMLERERFDYFPRSSIEIWQELETHKNMDLIADPHIVLHYPTAAYFFITKRRPDLANDFQIGFEKIILNGKFERLFQKYNQETILKSDLKSRKIIQLNNPLLDPKNLPLQRSELWFRP